MHEKYYVGLDLHSTNTYIGILDNLGKKMWSGRVNNDLQLIISIFEPYRESLAGVVVESTYNWYWLVDGLMDAGFTVHLGNPVAFQQYKGLKYTDDSHDAFFLAEMLRLGILPEGYIYPKEERQVRDLLRKRLLLVQQRTQHVLSFKSLVSRNLGFSIGTNQIRRLKSGETNDWFGNDHLRFSARASLDAIDYLHSEIKELESIIINSTKVQSAYELLSTVPGIGKVLSMTIALETGDINRFKTVGDYASYCRCVPSSRISNGKTKGKNNTKNGNKYLAWTYIEAANFMKRFKPSAQLFYQKKTAQSNKVLAIKALAHKISRACFYILRDNVPFDEVKMFGNPKRCDKGCSSEPERGLRHERIAPIGPSAATNLTVNSL